MAAPNPEAVEADALTPGYPLRLLGAPAYDANGWADGTTASRQTIVPSASAAPTQGFTFDGPGASPSTALSLVPAQQTLSLLGPSLLSTTPQSSCVAPLDPSANRAGFGSENQLTNTWTGSLHGQPPSTVPAFGRPLSPFGAPSASQPFSFTLSAPDTGNDGFSSAAHVPTAPPCSNVAAAASSLFGVSNPSPSGTPAGGTQTATILPQPMAERGDPAVLRMWLTDLYGRYDPEKLWKIEKLMAKYRNNEGVIVSKILKKYEKEGVRAPPGWAPAPPQANNSFTPALPTTDKGCFSLGQTFTQQISTSTNDKWYGFTCSRLESTGFGAYHTSSSPDFSAGAAAGTSLFASATSGLPSGAPPQANSSAACSRVGSFLAPPATSATAPAASGLGGLFTDTISVESTTHVRWIGASAPAAASAFDSVAPTSTERLTAFNSASTGATGGGTYGVTSRYSTVDVFRTSRFAASSGPSRWFPPDAGIFSTSIASSTEETWGITPSATSTPAAQLYGTSRGRGTGKPAWRGSSMEPTRYGMQPTDVLVSISAMTEYEGESHEELRLGDYLQNRKNNVACPLHGGATNTATSATSSAAFGSNYFPASTAFGGHNTPTPMQQSTWVNPRWEQTLRFDPGAEAWMNAELLKNVSILKANEGKTYEELRLEYYLKNRRNNWKCQSPPGDTTGTTAFTTSPVAGGSLAYLPLLKRHLGIHATEWEQTPEDAATAEPGEDPGMLMSISAMPEYEDLSHEELRLKDYGHMPQ